MEKKALENEEDRKQKKTEKTPSHARWVIRVFLIAVALSAAMSLDDVVISFFVTSAETTTLPLKVYTGLRSGGTPEINALSTLMIGVAVTAAQPKPFNSMAAHRVKGAKEALYLIRNAEKVASFCNDVVGDICGIVSGSTATVIVVLLQNSFGWRSIVVSTVVTALISGLTIGGKAIGKKVAMKKSKDVIYLTAKVLSVLHLVR